MPTFKHKTNKKIVLDEKSIITLDSKHKEIEKDFQNEKEDILPELRAKKKHYIKLLKDEILSIDQKLEIDDLKLSSSQSMKKFIFPFNSSSLSMAFSNCSFVIVKFFSPSKSDGKVPWRQ